MPRLAVTLALVATAGCPGAPGAGSTGPSPLSSVDALAADYRGFLDRGRTPAHAIAYVIERGGFTAIDPREPPAAAIAAGSRLLFVDRNRTAILAVVGRRPIADAGFRMVGAHIDAPAPRLITTGLSRQSQKRIETYRYGGTKTFHWHHRPLAIVGSAVGPGGDEILVELGLGNDDFAMWSEAGGKGVVLTTGSTPSGQKDDFDHLVGELHERYGLTAADLAGAELYAVPKDPAREVGLDRAMIGAHGQDDRANSYVAWRALTDLDGTGPITAMTWLVDREETGSAGATGARSRFLELVVGYLVRGQGGELSESVLHRAMAESVVLSSDTPACLNPNWPEVHEKAHAPRAGAGPAVFPYPGRRGKQGGSAASAELIASVRATFAAARLPLQFALLGHVDAGGGGTISKYLAHRGAAVVDLGVCVISMHSPFELVAKDDLWAMYQGLRAWFAGR